MISTHDSLTDCVTFIKKKRMSERVQMEKLGKLVPIDTHPDDIVTEASNSKERDLIFDFNFSNKLVSEFISSEVY